MMMMMMGRLMFITFLVMNSCLVKSTEGRKLLLLQEKTEFEEIKKVPAGQGLMDRVFKNLFVKGQVPASSPSKRGHADTVDEKLVARHLAALHRIPGSVPSPGTGN
ncbi:hypothetical protein DM860_008003 [Cuscuta australis]|uniref:Uncharacterized protein n=1 Tax=Cuscuta australis TaxID=267555 RepID=A0A328E124_9ASTE|nr:hypothetical protein DM860_008003 [Cuscuta australis]